MAKEFDLIELGPLTVCADPAYMAFDGKRCLWPANWIKLVAQFARCPQQSPDELSEALGVDRSTLVTKVSDVRRAILISGLPMKLVSVKDTDGLRVDFYKFEIGAAS